MSKGTWDIGVMKVIKGEKMGHCASHGKEMLKTLEWQIQSRAYCPTTGRASRCKIAT
jgi:hypothetical protein